MERGDGGGEEEGEEGGNGEEGAEGEEVPVGDHLLDVRNKAFASPPS